MFAGGPDVNLYGPPASQDFGSHFAITLKPLPKKPVAAAQVRNSGSGGDEPPLANTANSGVRETRAACLLMVLDLETVPVACAVAQIWKCTLSSTIAARTQNAVCVLNPFILYIFGSMELPRSVVEFVCYFFVVRL